MRGGVELEYLATSGGLSENRTRTPVKVQVFETCASTNSAKRPWRIKEMVTESSSILAQEDQFALVLRCAVAVSLVGNSL